MSVAALQPIIFRVTTKGLMRRAGWQIMLAVVFGGLGVGLMLMGLSRPETNTLSPGALCFLGGLAAAVHGFLATKNGVREFQLDATGFTWEDETGRNRANWDKVVALNRVPKLIVNGMVQAASTTLLLTGGRKVVVDFTLEGYDRLAGLLQHMRATHLLPALLAELDAGRPVGFGPVFVDLTGVEYQGRHRPWHTFAYAFDSGRLVMVPAGDAFGWEDRTEVGVADLPDVAALREVLARYQSPADSVWTIPPHERERLIRS
jgi:hypothetical protein